jgi:hypothetical protein
MSLDFLTRPIGGSKKTADPDAPAAPQEKRRGAPNPEDVRRTGTLSIGGSPRVDLMPPEIRVKRSQLATRRKLRMGLVAVAAVVALGCGGTVALSTVSNIGLAAAQEQQTSLLQQQNQYADVKHTMQSILLIQAGQKVAASTEIDWSGYLAKLSALLPAGMTVEEVQLDQATPVAPYTGSTTSAAAAARVATLTVTTTGPDIPPTAQILTSMATLPGFIDVVPTSVAFDASNNAYKSTIVLHIDEKAFDGRYQPATSADPSAAPTAGGQG